MATSNVLPQALRSITGTKISELSKQKSVFESRKAALYAVAAEQSTLHDRIRVLLEGVTRIKGFPDDGLEVSDEDEEVERYEAESELWARSHLRNMRRYLFQSQYDSSMSRFQLEKWERDLRRELDILSIKHDHALFFSRLVTEWLAHPNEPAIADEVSGLDGSFQPVGREEMHQQRSQWEEIVFQEEGRTDPRATESFLTDLFTRTKLSEQALKDIRMKVRDFGKTLMSDKNAFNVETMKWVTQGVIQGDLFPPEKVTTLKEFLSNDAVSQEVADILNMRLAQVDLWNWDSDAIPVEMRRNLNGKYRVYMDEDILDALFFQFIGVKWGVKFKECFTSFLHTHAWKSNARTPPKQDLERRRYFLGEDNSAQADTLTVDKSRWTDFKDKYFMTQLPSTEFEQSHYDDDGKETGSGKNAMNLKHSLLHLLITESHLHKALYGGMTVIRSDFKWFGPSLPHSSLLAVLRFFDVPQVWLEFFSRFLAAPLKFAEDGPNAQTRIRKRGVPTGHTISDFLSESLLFCMDYSVNQHADGMFLYRLHDDFWFWGPEERCTRAWKTLSNFAALMGIEFNEEKTGTARLGREERTCKETFEQVQDMDTEEIILPEGDVRWGFLKLDEEEGRFVIDLAQIDVHIEELQRQLAACKSVLSWVKAWNGYVARFFTNNFGKPAMCFGRKHIEMVVYTLQRIETKLFSNSEGNPSGQCNIADYLRRVIAERFDVHDLPDGFFYFPVEMGGLDLRNPFIPFLNMREGMKITPERILEKAFIAEEEEYSVAKQQFETEGPRYIFSTSVHSSSGSDGPVGFMSLEEYNRYCESTSNHLSSAYGDLLSEPEEVSVDRTPNLQRAQAYQAEPLTLGDSTPHISPNWHFMSPYWKWVAELYHEGMVEKYGGMSAVENGVVPLGVLKVLKEGKIQWQK